MPRKSLLPLLLVTTLLLISFCSEKPQPQGPQFAFVQGDRCVECHTSESMLKKTASPLPPHNGEAGEG